MADPVEFPVTWAEFHAIMQLGGNTHCDWSTHVLRAGPRLEEVLGAQRAAELLVLLETHDAVGLAPIPRSLVSYSRHAKTTPSPPPSGALPEEVIPMPPLPSPPPVSRVPPPKAHVPTSPLSPQKPSKLCSPSEEDPDE